MTINASGQRDDPLTPARRPGAKRVLALGDSWTFGIGVVASATWPERLEALLGGRDEVEVVNCGVSGYETYNEAVVYERDLGAIEHDLLLVGFFPVNDVNEKTHYETYRRLHDIHPALLDLWLFPKRHLMISHVYANWRKDLRRRQRQAKLAASAGQPEDAPTDWTALYDERNRGWQGCKAALHDLGRVSHARGVRAAVVLFPDVVDLRRYLEHDHPRIAPLLAAAAADAGLELIDVADAFRPYVGREAEISGAFGSTHLASDGYAVLARAIHEALLARGLVNEPRAEH